MTDLRCIAAAVFLVAMAAPDRTVRAAGGVYQIGVVRTDGVRTTGSAVQLSPGQLLASCHTVSRASEILVLHANRPFRAAVVKADAHHDLCLLRTARFSGAVPERVASSALRVGEKVSAYGFASGFRMSIAVGRITALHRFDDADVIRTSARFPRGASGGALFDDRGRLVGMLAFQARDPALNYALPMEWVERLLDPGDEGLPAQDAAAFWDQSSHRQPVFLRAAQLEFERDWAALEDLSVEWSTRDPGDAQAWRSLGRAQFGTGRAELARQAFERAVSLEPASAEVWYWLGRAAEVTGDPATRGRALDRLRALDMDLAGQLDIESGTVDQ